MRTAVSEARDCGKKSAVTSGIHYGLVTWMSPNFTTDFGKWNIIINTMGASLSQIFSFLTKPARKPDLSPHPGVFHRERAAVSLCALALERVSAGAPDHVRVGDAAHRPDRLLPGQRAGTAGTSSTCQLFLPPLDRAVTALFPGVDDLAVGLPGTQPRRRCGDLAAEPAGRRRGWA